jgi:GEVED domain/Right handed beta helix region/SdrD B-like domain
VTNSVGNATLHAWVDFNKNGSFEASEYASTPVNNGATSATLSWTVPSGTTAGSSYARFRLTTQTLTDNTGTVGEDERSIGAASDGEVEDYAVAIAQPFPPISSCDANIYTVTVAGGSGGIQRLGGLSPAGYTPTTLSTTFPFSTMYNLVKAGDNNLYYADSGTAATSFVYKFDTTTNTSSPTSWQLPAPGVDGYWISGSTDPAGMLYFISGKGNKLVKVDPYTNIVSTVWSTAPTTTVKDPQGRNFGVDYVDIGFDVNGDAFLIDNLNKYIWKVTNVNGSSPKAQYLGTITGASASQLSDIVWLKDSGGVVRLYVLGNNGVYVVDTSTYAATFVTGSSTHYYDIAGCSDFGVVNSPAGISGTVFEDPNYGGGAGRDLTTLTTSPRSGARVELYKSNGTYVGTTTTSAAGTYTFAGLFGGDYKIRVVNSTVTSSRPGYVNTLLPVQTFRTDATTGTVIAVTDHVGGEKPQEVDAPANTTSANLSTLDTATQEVQSITTVKVAGADVTGIDFGYNFDTIVNTNNAGQGSLRQFITNSNTLTNAGLAQQGLTTGRETSIFMIPVGSLNGTGGNANTAVINLAANFTITDSNTSLDASTQTTNIGDTNFGTVGTGGSVGVDSLPLSLIPKPEIVIDLQAVPINTNAILVSGASTVLKGFAIYGYRSAGGLGTLVNSAIVIQAGVSDTGAANVTQLLGGSLADGTNPGVPTSTIGHTFQTAGAANISNNYFAYNADAIEFWNTNGTHINFTDNELAYNGPKDNNVSNVSGIYSDQMETAPGAKNITIRGNLVRNSSKPNYTNAQGQGIQISYATFVTLENNTFIDNNVYGINASASDTLISKNIITGTKNTGLGQGSGIAVYYGGPSLTGLRNRITQNSIFQNAKLGIDHQVDGVTPNDGGVNAAQPNNGIDYPIITSSSLSSGTLTVSGYVGNNASGSATFANLTLEFFVADDDGNNNGAVILGDGKSLPHGEGKTYIGGSTTGNLCTTNASGLFSCTFPNAGTFGLTSSTNITATATDSAGNTSEFSSVPNASNANVLLVKRITAINGNRIKNPNDLTPLNVIVDDSLTNDNNANWPNPKTSGISSFLQGVIDAGKVKPGDTIEYTIYFLNADVGNTTGVKICDRITGAQSFLTDAYGVTGSGKDIQIHKGNGSFTTWASASAVTSDLTSVNDIGDRAQVMTTASAPNSCHLDMTTGGATDTGTLVIDITGPVTSNQPAWSPVAGSTGVGTADSYGFIRFTTTVNP